MENFIYILSLIFDKASNLLHVVEKKRLAAAVAFSQPFQNSSMLSCVDLKVCRKWGTFLGASVVTSGVYFQRCDSFDVFISSKQDVPTYLQYGGTQLPAFCHICA